MAELILHPDMQPRTNTDRTVVERYRKAFVAGVQFPPVSVASVGGALTLVDGFHRVQAMRAAFIRTTLANDLGDLSWEEARWLACKANLTHGLPMKGVERRAVFRAFVRAGHHLVSKGRRGSIKTYRQMAVEMGGVVSYSTIRKWMEADFPTIFGRMAHGEVQRGGDLRAKSPDTVMTAEANAALDHALAAIEGVSNPEARYRLLIKAKTVVENLEAGNVKEPDF